MTASYTPLHLDKDNNIQKPSGNTSQMDIILLALVVVTLGIIASILYILLTR